MTLFSPKIALASIALVATAGIAPAQSASVKDQVVGMWMLKAADNVGPSPLGIFMFDAAGHFTMMHMKNGMAKYTSNLRSQATPEEAKATVLGVLAGFGTYKIMGSDIVFHFVGSSFPNWNGTDQLITSALKGTT